MQEFIWLIHCAIHVQIAFEIIVTTIVCYLRAAFFSPLTGLLRVKVIYILFYHIIYVLITEIIVLKKLFHGIRIEY